MIEDMTYQYPLPHEDEDSRGSGLGKPVFDSDGNPVMQDRADADYFLMQETHKRRQFTWVSEYSLLPYRGRNEMADPG